MKKRSLNEIAETLLVPPPAASQSIDEDRLQYDEEYARLAPLKRRGVDIEAALEYGFYEDKNRYWIRRREDTFEPVSNFTMKVLYLIMGAQPKRIVEITNVRNRKTVIDMGIEDLISLDKFKARVESQGNYLFEGKPADLGKIKNKLFNDERPSIEINRLGQYKKQFFAFANGIYDGENFLPVDDKGMVTCRDEHYYIPVFGSTKSDDDDDLRNYRRFLHRENAATFAEWSQLFCDVYGENGHMGIAFSLFALFSDLIFEQTKGAPMLFLFGQRGSGKGTMANSLMALFGVPQDPIMLGGASTVVGFMRKLGQFSNAIVWLDEYKNDIGEKKIESLKNIWDRVGYERGVKDSSNRTQSTPVTSSAIVSGQEIPNVEPALFSRTVLCEFKAMQRGQKEVDNFNRLRSMEDAGITNVTLEILTHRKQFAKRFTEHYDAHAKMMRKAFSGEEVIERQINNYAILIACVASLEDLLPFPKDFNSTQLALSAERYIKRQRDMMSTANEVQQFFEMVAYLLSAGLIKDGRDLHIFQGLVKIRTVSIFPLYREYSRRQGMKPMDRGTLMNYMKNSPAYCEKESQMPAHRFPDLQNPTSCSIFLQYDLKKIYGIDFAEVSQLPENETIIQKSSDEPAF